MTTAAMLVLASLIAVEPPAADAASMAFEKARASVVRGALATIEKSIVTIETIGGAQPLAEQDSVGQPQPGHGGRGRPPGRGRPQGPVEESFRLADGPTTGVIISDDGLILTSSINFARNPAIITVVLPDGSRKVARQLGVDYIRRIALVKIDAAGLPACEWVDEVPEVGQFVIACGRGLGGARPSASLGIVSAVNRRNGSAVQTDAKTSPVNYGGPLVDIDGRVVGIIVPLAGEGGALAGAEWYDSGIGFAVIKPRIDIVLPDLVAGRSFWPGRMGVMLANPEASLTARLDELIPWARKGVKIESVIPGSPAAKAGLEDGDTIIALEGQTVSDRMELQRRLSDLAAGTKVKVTIRRTFRTLDVELTLATAAEIRRLASDGAPEMPEDGATTQPSAD